MNGILANGRKANVVFPLAFIQTQINLGHWLTVAACKLLIFSCCNSMPPRVTPHTPVLIYCIWIYFFMTQLPSAAIAPANATCFALMQLKQQKAYKPLCIPNTLVQFNFQGHYKQIICQCKKYQMLIHTQKHAKLNITCTNMHIHVFSPLHAHTHKQNTNNTKAIITQKYALLSN